jgi:integrase
VDGQVGHAIVSVDGGFEAQWTDDAGAKHTGRQRTHAQAVQHVARHQAGGLRFHDLRQSYATWLVDDGVPPNMVQRVMGHERSATNPEDEDPDDDGASAPAPV